MYDKGVVGSHVGSKAHHDCYFVIQVKVSELILVLYLGLPLGDLARDTVAVRDRSLNAMVNQIVQRIAIQMIEWCKYGQDRW